MNAFYTKSWHLTLIVCFLVWRALALRDKEHARRLMAILLLHEGHTSTDVHRNTGAARSTIGRWLNWYRDEGVDALASLPAGRTPVLPVAKIVTALVYYAFPDKSSAATDRKRQSRVCKALDELDWSISEHAKGRFTIGRPALS